MKSPMIAMENKYVTVCTLVIILILIAVIVWCKSNETHPIYNNPNDVLKDIMKSNGSTESSALSYIKHINSICDELNREVIDEKYKNVFVIPNVLTEDECKWLIYEAEQYAKQSGWTTRRHAWYPTTDNETKNIPNIAYFVENRVYQKIIPEFEKHYGIQSKYLGVDETFIVKYSIGGQSYLEPHTDGDDFSFVLTLNKDFVGGGTYFIERDQHMDAPIGSAVIFCGRNQHMGKEISSGIRYIIAGFCSYGKNSYCSNISDDPETHQKEIFKPFYSLH